MLFSTFWRCFLIKNNNSKELSINENIRSDHGFPASKIVRVIGADNEQLGMMALSNALDKAYDSGLDLVLIAPQGEPPVCRIMDYGKFRFEKEKKEKEARKKQQIAELKEIQLSCLIDVGDFNTKVNHAIRFLGNGDKVKVVVKFKGRQMTHQDIGRDLLTKFEAALEGHGTVEKKPLLEGRFLSMVIGPIKQTSAKN